MDEQDKFHAKVKKVYDLGLAAAAAAAAATAAAAAAICPFISCGKCGKYMVYQ